MTLENLLQYRDTKIVLRVTSHILFWLLFYAGFAYYNQISFNPFKDNPLSYLAPLQNTISVMFVFYLLLYGSAYFFRKKQYKLVVILVISSIIIYPLLGYIGEQLIYNNCDVCLIKMAEVSPEYEEYLSKGAVNAVFSRVGSLGSTFLLITYLAIPMFFAAGLRYHQYYTNSLKLAKKNIQLELNFLKAQINPHFLFNTLNNLYGLIIHERIEKSAETVVKLSDFMRYTLDNASKQSILLDEEIKLMRSYIELEQLRLNHTKVQLKIFGNITKISIPPLLFMPLIENAFKYNIDRDETTISIEINLQHGVLDFKINNSFDPQQENSRSSGLGLTNLEKRLAICFPNKNKFISNIENEMYTANLILNLL